MYEVTPRSDAAPGVSRPAWERPGILAVGIAVLTLAVFGPTLGFDFVLFDDDGYVTNNSALRKGLTLETLSWAWHTGYMSNWHPLTWISLLIDYEIHGVDPAGYHATNVALHLLTALLIFGWLRGATRCVGRSALVAALFAVHPMHVESVAWVSERKDVLSGLFGILSLWAYCAYARRGGAARYAGVALTLALGLMAKPMLVTFPLVMLLLDVWPLGRLRWARRPAGSDAAPPPPHARLLLEKLPLLALSASAALLAYEAQRRGGLVAGAAWVGLWERIATALHAYGWYLTKAIWPVGLAVHYPHPFLSERGGDGLAAWQVLLPALALVAVSAAAVQQRRRRPWLLVGWLWYVGTLVPVIGLVQLSSQGMADRYSYLPLIGVFLPVAWGGEELRRVLARRIPLRPWLVPACATALVLLAAQQARFQAQYWRDSASLFRHALEIVPDDTVVQVHLAIALQSQGRFAEALPHLDRAVARAPRWPLPRFERGLARLRSGDLTGAERDFLACARLTPAVPEVHLNLAGVRVLLGRPAEAVPEYLRALALRPDDVALHLALGRAYQEDGRLAQAEGTYRAALAIAPDDPEALYRLGSALGADGELDQAIALLERAVAIEPDHEPARRRLEMARRLVAGATASPQADLATSEHSEFR